MAVLQDLEKSVSHHAIHSPFLPPTILTNRTRLDGPIDLILLDNQVCQTNPHIHLKSDFQ
jgi:hypothetical protein